MRNTSAIAVCLAAAVSACGEQPEPSGAPLAPASLPTPPSRLRYADVTTDSGIAFQDRHGRVGVEKQFLFETIGGGAALIDHDADGDLDVFLCGGDPLDGSGPDASALFRNDGRMRFADATAAARIDLRRDATGTAVGDVDGDGDDDLYVAAFGPNALLVNAGGSFDERAESAGVAHPGYASSTLLADFDVDGDLDLFVANYLTWNAAAVALSEEGGTFRGHRVIAGPRGLEGAADVLYANESGAAGVRFRDATAEAGLSSSRSFALGCLAADLDGDGRLDLYVANDSEANSLFLGRGGLRFEEHGVASGTAFDGSGMPQAGMGVDAGDADGDGDLDLFVTNFSHDHNTLYVQHRPGQFSDASRRHGLFLPSLQQLGFGCVFTDGDLDGDLDLAIANGHVFAVLDHVPMNTTYAQANQVYENVGDGMYREVSEAWMGPGHEAQVSRGLARGDLDGDGREDLLVTNLNGTPCVLRNVSEGGAPLVLRLVATTSAPGAIGARVEIDVADGVTLVRHVVGGGSFASASSRDVVVGLGARDGARGVRVRWPSGAEQRFGALRARTLVVLTEGVERVEERSLEVADG